MARKHEMTDAELLAILAQYEREAIGSSVASGVSVWPGNNSNLTTLEIDNYEAWNYYNAAPLGNEQPNRSQIVIPVLRDVIEWIMPQLMRVFCSGVRICRFDPENPNDTALAEQQSDVCNYIFMRQNDGFFVLYDYIKEALLLRNGYMKAEWVTRKVTKIERYTGLTEDALTQLSEDAEEAGDEIAFTGKDERSQTHFVPQSNPQTGAVEMVPQTQPVFDIQLRRTSKHGEVRVIGVPREHVYVSPRARKGLDDTPYVCHKETKSRSELIEEGYDREVVESAAPGRPEWLNIDALARARVLDELDPDKSNADPSMDVLEVRDNYVRVDYDGDGVAELRRVVVIGDQVAENEEIMESALASGTAIRMPHRHVGVSLFELLKDLQQIKTDLMRQGLDNAYLINNTRIAADQDNVNFDDLMTNRPGGIVRTKGAPAGLLEPLVVPNALTDIEGMMQYVDGLQQWRTGVGQDTTVMDPDALQNVTKANGLALLSKSDLKIEQMARLLAEGIKDIFVKINNLMIEHQEEPLTLELRGQWVNVDPSKWKMRTAVSPNIGLGSGNREELRANLMMLAQVLQQGHQAGMVSPQNVFNFLRKSVEALGFNSPQEFITDPRSPEGQQLQKHLQQPPLPLQIAQLKAQGDARSAQQSAMLDVQKTRAQQQAETAKDVFQARLQAAIASEKARLDAQAKLAQTGADMQAEREKAYLQIAAQITEAALKAAAQPQQITADLSAAEGAVNGHA